ncbi:hypothetical protein GCM10027200_05590 [Lentzea nigeriaca]
MLREVFAEALQTETAIRDRRSERFRELVHIPQAKASLPGAVGHLTVHHGQVELHGDLGLGANQHWPEPAREFRADSDQQTCREVIDLSAVRCSPSGHP